MPSMRAPIGHQQAGEVLDVRLGGGVVDHGRAGRERGGHQRVLGGHDRRLVHEEVARVQPVGRRQAVPAAVHVHLGAERAEGVQVRVEPAAADHVAAGRRHVGAAAGARAAGRRAGTRRGCARPSRGPPRSGSSSSARSATTLSSRHSTFTSRRRSSSSIASTSRDARDVPQHDLLARQQRRGERGQSGVLVAGGRDRPREGRRRLR